ncbi:RmlC-like cupin [Calocera viscosa TUFC12733]|uniref:RmlC-like cupin n=1 Tax=Calocera viscosa (strain TUFC12733) TaxID=1330018 RepID=A0A167Q4P0_CALVF|nr:RmlC-like cupin [Calocera viscosa TUFC12733]
MAPTDTVSLIKANELSGSTGQTDGMARYGAIAGLSDKLNANLMVAEPHTHSAVHHHGDQDTIVFGQKGKGAVVFNGGKDRVNIAPGDFALIPAGVEHEEVNEGDEQVVWVIVRSGSVPKVVNLEGWGEAEKKQA